jgi:uncharacterized membrane protein
MANTTGARTASLIMGIGFGGFIDGIVLHQLLQWHHMLTGERRFPMDTVAGLEGNGVADGAFHAGTWVLVFAGVLLALRAWHRGEYAPPWRAHFGLLAVGWGLFNLVEGIVDHQILGIHHVRDDLGGPRSWDYGFLALSAVLVIIGVMAAHSGAADREV